MAIIFLFYTEDEAWGGSLSAAKAIPMLDQFVYMFGGTIAAIHPKDADYPPHCGLTYPTLEDAQKAYSKHKWIYLKPTAKMFIDELEHPEDNVVYAVGHDRDGFGKSKLKGEKVKLKTLRDDFEGHAIPTLITTICDRWTRIGSKK